MDQVREIAAKTPGIGQVISISGVSPLDNNASLSSAWLAYLMLKDWSRSDETTMSSLGPSRAGTQMPIPIRDRMNSLSRPTG